jgi:type II secretory pathway component HofQ
MSVASERLAVAMSRMDQISREHADRRELRERRTREAKEQASDSFAKQGQVAQKIVERLNEAEKAQKAAGGWNTQAATEKKSGEYKFGAEDDEPTYETPPPPTTSWTPTPQPPLPPPTAVPPPPPPPPARPAPRRPAPVDDDDDFGGQSWLT